MKVIAEYFGVSVGVHFNAKTLNKILVGNRALAQEINNINKDVLCTHCGIFCNKYKPKGSYSTVWYYYATTPGNIPSSLMMEGKKWYKEISSATKSLNKISYE